MRVTPGIAIPVNLRRLDPTEADIIKYFAQTWFVSSAGIESFKGIGHIYAFLKPSYIFTNTFQLERELLLYFDHSIAFDPKKLDFVDYMLTKHPNRLDRLCVVLVSRDQTIVARMNRRGLDDPESRIIVPFTYFELGSSQWAFNNPDRVVQAQINRFKDLVFTRDLFGFSSPLRNVAHFFGRKQVIGNLYNKYREGENLGLFGLRKIGKTSVLYAIKRRLEARGEPCVFLDGD